MFADPKFQQRSNFQQSLDSVVIPTNNVSKSLFRSVSALSCFRKLIETDPTQLSCNHNAPPTPHPTFFVISPPVPPTRHFMSQQPPKTFASFKGTINLQPTLQTTKDLLSQPTTSIPTSHLTSLAARHNSTAQMANNANGPHPLTKLPISQKTTEFQQYHRKFRTEREISKLKNSDWIMYGNNQQEIMRNFDVDANAPTVASARGASSALSMLQRSGSDAEIDEQHDPTAEDPFLKLMEHEQLSQEMRELFRSSKAATLWNISEGTSVVTERAKNSAYFMEDFDRYMRSDALEPDPLMPNSRPGTMEKSRPGTRARISRSKLMSGQSQGRPGTGLTGVSRPGTGGSIFSGFSDDLSRPNTGAGGGSGLYRDLLSGGSRRGGAPQPGYASDDESDDGHSLKHDFTPLPPDVIDRDDTWRTYQSNPNGRTVVSIYHSETKRPTNVQSFIQKSAVTNESLYTYITTEYVEELNLERCVWIANRILRYIGEFCPHLNVLNLQHCVQLRDSTLSYIAKGCKNLMSLNVGMCDMISDASLVSVFENCKFLKILSVHSCPLIDGSSLSSVAKCPNIEVFDFSYCPKLTDVALQCIGEYCPHVRHIDLSGCKEIGNEGFISLMQHCVELETIRIMLCDQPQLNGIGLRVATRYAFNLRVLEMTGVKHLTDEALVEILKYGRALEFLSISGCEDITDAGLAHAPQTCHNLRCVEMSRCRKISLAAMIDLVHNIKTLSKLVINDCFISEAQLKILEKVTNRCVILKQQKIVEKPKLFFTYVKPAAKKKGKKGKKGAKKGAGKKKKK